MGHESDGDINCNWCTRCNYKRIVKGTGGIVNKRMSRNHPSYGIIKIFQNTENSLGDLTRLAVTQTPMENHQLILVWKTDKGVCEKKDKYLDLARELKKLWNKKVTIVPIVIGTFGIITKELLEGLEGLEVGGRVETIQMTALLRTARILRRVLETWGELL